MTLGYSYIDSDSHFGKTVHYTKSYKARRQFRLHFLVEHDQLENGNVSRDRIPLAPDLRRHEISKYV